MLNYVAGFCVLQQDFYGPEMSLAKDCLGFQLEMEAFN